jgi:hypothetical protein
MSRKPKFRPKITRVKLNPEQAVLACACYNQGWRVDTMSYYRDGTRVVNPCVGAAGKTSGLANPIISDMPYESPQQMGVSGVTVS